MIEWIAEHLLVVWAIGVATMYTVGLTVAGFGRENDPVAFWILAFVTVFWPVCFVVGVVMAVGVAPYHAGLWLRNRQDAASAVRATASYTDDTDS